jgi:hypothetical protein
MGFKRLLVVLFIEDIHWISTLATANEQDTKKRGYSDEPTFEFTLATSRLRLIRLNLIGAKRSGM